MIEKIISGGQTGADRAALDFAIKRGMSYGGWVPKGRKTEDGTLPETYLLQEMPTGQYSRRTEKNILDSDGTLIVSHGLLTGGSALTAEFARIHKRPRIHIDLEITTYLEAATMVQEWIKQNEIRVMNVAGPRASKDPKIYDATLALLEMALKVNESKDYPHTLDEAVDRLYADISLNEEILLSTINEGSLSDLHFSLGHKIRNEFGLWSGNYGLLESCRKLSGNENLHVDDASMIIIEVLWEKVKKKNILQD
ncbi:MAG: putative molybdenum carrier protein [Syntrophaceae bacterium]|nr:putative molybdenum carrier protein [Syntrophaceae bacterium]